MCPARAKSLLCSGPDFSPPKRLLRERLQAITIAVAWWLTLKTIDKRNKMKSEKSASKYVIVVGIDRSDKELEVAVRGPEGSCEVETVSTRPEALNAWWERLREAHPQGLIAVGFEQPARALLAFFEFKADVAVYALNPSSIWGYRQSLKVSRAHTDSTDATCIASFLSLHHGELRVYQPASPLARQLQLCCVSRRKIVNSRTALTNRLLAILKDYFPAALDLLSEDVYRPLNVAMLRRWPRLSDIQAASESQLRSFFKKQGSHSETRLQQRLLVISNAQTLTKNEAIIEPNVLQLLCLLDQIEALNSGVLMHDRHIRKLMQQNERAALFIKLPGAGPAYAPRVFAAFEAHAPNCKDAAALASLVGMAPVTEQSGNMRRVYRRLRCDRFLAQSFHEFATESWKHSRWANAFVKHHQAEGKPYHSIMRKLAVRWIRILFRMWQTGQAYDEQKYINSLLKRDHYLTPYLT
jgi:transposase